ncbi:MAG: SgcJ/EcaC family oxidoreductase [Acidobacteriaceae bacterium]|nr:SgcJ/EcaC family oxidoreductase [Acidobacteriaceae bacterium]
MRTLSALLLVIGFVFSNCSAKAADTEEDIRDLLANQTDAWNRGDLQAFIKPYAEDCIFIGKQVVKGRGKVLERYKNTYPTPAAMGKLFFRNMEVRELSERIAFVTGEWRLERPVSAGGTVGGIFSLVLKDFDDEWRIVLDHTSRQQPDSPAPN